MKTRKTTFAKFAKAKLEKDSMKKVTGGRLSGGDDGWGGGDDSFGGDDGGWGGGYDGEDDGWGG